MKMLKLLTVFLIGALMYSCAHEMSGNNTIYELGFQDFFAKITDGTELVSGDEGTHYYCLSNDAEMALYRLNGEKLYAFKHQAGITIDDLYIYKDNVYMRKTNHMDFLENNMEVINLSTGRTLHFPCPTNSFLIYKDELYFNRGENYIKKLDLYGDPKEEILLGEETEDVCLIKIENDIIYYSLENKTGDYIMTIDLKDGSKDILIDSNLFGKNSLIYDFDVKGSDVYALVGIEEYDQYRYYLFGCNIKEDNFKKLINDEVEDFLIIDNYVYYTNISNRNYVYRKNMGNDDVEELFIKIKAHRLLYYDAFIYFMKIGDDYNVYRMPKEGGDLENIISCAMP